MSSYFQFFCPASSMNRGRKELREKSLQPEENRAEELVRSFEVLQLSPEKVNQRLKLLLNTLGKEAKGSITEQLTKVYPLNTPEGLLLLRLAEALPRITDDQTALVFFKEEIRKGNWHNTTRKYWLSFLISKLKLLIETFDLLPLLSVLSDKALILFIQVATRLLVDVFVLAPDVERARRRLFDLLAKGEEVSLDLLGEDAQGSKDGLSHWENCQKVIEMLGDLKAAFPRSDPEMSVKISALDSKYELHYSRISFDRIYSKVKSLCLAAQQKAVGLCIDAEQYWRFEFALDLLEALLSDPDLKDWNKMGFVVQSYLKNSEQLVDYLAELCKEKKKKLSIRLVKGAYWDHEIIHAQQIGLEQYPVYTLKELTELSYMLCLKKLFQHKEVLGPRLATHNPSTIAAILEFHSSFKENPIEFQRLYGLGQSLGKWLKTTGYPTRVYIPIGKGKELFGYLARRLIENGTALENFLYPFDFEKLRWDPLSKLQQRGKKHNPHIPLPPQLYKDRENAPGLDLANPETWENLVQKTKGFHSQPQLFFLYPQANGTRQKIFSPANPKECIGEVLLSSEDYIQKSLSEAATHAEEWDRVPVEKRAEKISKLAREIWAHKEELLYLLCAEAGKTVSNAVSEIREAIDFCNYYAKEAVKLFSHPLLLPGPHGEENKLHYHGCGLWVCISPWNFPLSIFIGQIVAALLAGNTVAAKPAEETPLVATAVVQLAYKAGIPKEVLRLILGNGQSGQQMVKHPSVRGVAFTGSTATAKRIAQCLSQKEGPIVPLIAETGGINCMVVEATAAIERTVKDILISAFNHAGQRCSSLRLLLVQKEISHQLLDLLSDATEQLIVGDPRFSETDVGPIIRKSLVEELQNFSQFFQSHGRLLAKAPIGETASSDGYFFAPHLFEISSTGLLNQEIFGPILPVLRFSREELPRILEEIYQKGYGLTMGLQTRRENLTREIALSAPVGNFYVNRPIIGAVVESQPFGGEGLSGTGPKAGGPNYLLRFARERVCSINTAALGDPSLYFLDQS
ncbi:bifunctional proline dehydrogenase/L-glutamate gamma-semialdehyde dehydrogenase PutA [Candidatus Methylacidiphilum infernorum]|uniref:Bifunctional proline dehydrogenase/L-glutamate gamma-semialdehyde dehydrogenase PutA n=1 Tax=Candidatus Methylacidiphilum infernorum TaxID=511746 RepID=A0ABX7PV60_9BACT|nr:bifunctional proline dehydrogenase/L-glutamate gamma-semialdehyde dehydrogenase PutA [Candidatus Methylacidiphilum infernorum]QSR86538.1 bifunctional proline dehydrogenase/L-glutamate gamma-semialdehyde dehydrogenase PutA [Candidatus Methylacidiphilum infernorum]